MLNLINQERKATPELRLRLASILVSARKDRAMNQGQFCALMGVTQSILSRMESGGCWTLRNIELASAALDCEPWELLKSAADLI